MFVNYMRRRKKAQTRNIGMMKIFLLCFLHLIGLALCGDFNVMDYGAKPGTKIDNAKAFEDTWKAACGSSGPATIWIPKAIFWLGPVNFTGQCKNVPSVAINMEGHLKAETGLNKYTTGDWIYFGWIDMLTIIGSGTLDGQGADIWHLNDCKKKKCKPFPTNIKFNSMTNTVIDGITSLDSKNFDFGVVGCKNFKAINLRIQAPIDSFNTDGMKVERSSDVTIQNSRIATGEDCISLGQGLSNVYISGITCGPGHGISIGSLGRYPQEKDVKGIIIKDSIIQGTMNGLWIKTWANSPSNNVVFNITYDNIILNSVENPIIIDQTYCPYGSGPIESPSRVRISDVTFNNIRGTSSSEMAVTLHCSKGFPCKNIKMNDINLEHINEKIGVKSMCMNIKPQYSGTQVPPPCTK